MSTVRFTEDGALGVLTLDSPPLNLIGEALIGDLLAAVDRVEASDGLRALLVRGEGRVFSAGADVALFAGKGSAEMRPLIASFLELGRRGPTLAFGVVKQLAHAYLQDGMPGADALLLDAAVSLFDTEDARRGIETFLATGAATASYEGH
jgi:enoyl-CoA hydratase/carnithine racemase